MTFWGFFGKSARNNDFRHLGSIEKRLKNEFSVESEEYLAELACVAGLLARVAFVDLNIEQSERAQIQSSITKWLKLDQNLAKKITDLVCEETKDLAGTENHLYANYLRDKLPESKRYSILEMLFAVAASDGNADNEESEEIRTITKGLGLEHKHFISARASVKEYLGSLKV